jgi:hypothetical protein
MIELKRWPIIKVNTEWSDKSNFKKGRENPKEEDKEERIKRKRIISKRSRTISWVNYDEQR